MLFGTYYLLYFADLTYVVTILTDIGEASTDPLTLRLQGETQTSTVISAVKIAEIPIYHARAVFILHVCNCRSYRLL